MAVVILHSNESIDAALKRFQRQVIKEGIIVDILDHRYFQSETEKERLRRLELRRYRKRKKRRGRRKPATKLKLAKMKYSFG